MRKYVDWSRQHPCYEIWTEPKSPWSLFTEILKVNSFFLSRIGIFFICFDVSTQIFMPSANVETIKKRSWTKRNCWNCQRERMSSFTVSGRWIGDWSISRFGRLGIINRSSSLATSWNTGTSPLCDGLSAYRHRATDVSVFRVGLVKTRKGCAASKVVHRSGEFPLNIQSRN